MKPVKFTQNEYFIDNYIASNGHCVRKFVRKLKIPYFRGVYMRDTLQKAPHIKECAILNLDSTLTGTQSSDKFN